MLLRSLLSVLHHRPPSTLHTFHTFQKRFRGITHPTFIDRVRIHVRGGSGGQGAAKIGAAGGDGGDVLVVADTGVATLAALQQLKRLHAGAGKPGAIKCRGVKGDDLVINVPLGTTITLETGQALADLSSHGQSVIVARGGEGGSAATNQRQGGLPGDALHLVFELKSIADVGLVGFPNAGKSSVLAALSRATPKVADYPFTTIQPNLGIIEYDDLGQIRMADIPGLIEGASENRGMGHAFLRHIERTEVLLFVVDINGFQLSPQSPFRTAAETLHLLVEELDAYEATLLRSRRALLAINKIDTFDHTSAVALTDLEVAVDQLTKSRRFSHRPLISRISALTGDGLPELAMALRQAVDQAKLDRLKREVKTHGTPQTMLDHLYSFDVETVKYFKEQTKRANERIW